MILNGKTPRLSDDTEGLDVLGPAIAGAPDVPGDGIAQDGIAQDMDAGGIRISQSLIKNLGREDACPRRIMEVYVNNLKTDPNEAQLKGMLFEYHITASAGISGQVPIEPVGTGNKRYVDFVRVEEQAFFVRDVLLPHYGFELYASDVELSTEFASPHLPVPITVRGRLDAIGLREGKPCIIDFKATATIDSPHAMYAWKSPSTMDHTQAYLYMWLYARNREVNWNGYIPDFYYIVAEWGPKKDYEIIRVKWNALKVMEVEQAIIAGHSLMRQHHADGWPEIPSFYECRGCPVRHACAKRKTFKEIKTVD